MIYDRCIAREESDMEWMAIIGNSIQYIEEHITEELTADRIAKNAGVSSFYF